MEILAAPSAGLGHRIHNIDACIFFARHVNAKVKVLWPRNQHLNCPFGDLFEPIEGVEVIETLVWQDFIRLQEEFSATRVLDGQFFADKRPKSDYWSAENFAENDRLIIKSWQRFFSRPYGTTNFVPSKKVADSVSRNAHLAECSIGIHVRRTDHEYAIKVSPADEFFSFLDVRSPEENYFLCTDSEKERQKFEMRYPGRVRSYASRSLDRKEPAAIQDAFVEMLLLAKCPVIVASDGSLFSYAAAYLGKSFLHRIKV